jgi:hypothetical protein
MLGWAALSSRLVLLGAGLVALGCSGRGVAAACEDIVECGGDPTGNWEAKSVCQATNPVQPLLSAPTNSRYTTPQTPALGEPQPPNEVAGDWCSGLVYLPASVVMGASPIRGIAFWSPPLTFRQGSVALLKDHTYSITASAFAPATTHFTPECIQAYGANPTCLQLQIDLAATPNPNYQDLACVDAADKGCDCSYEIEGTGSDTGNWQQVGSKIYQYSFSSGKPPQVASYCVSPDAQKLTLGGADGALITGASGLRTMSLIKVGDGSN